MIAALRIAAADTATIAKEGRHCGMDLCHLRIFTTLKDCRQKANNRNKFVNESAYIKFSRFVFSGFIFSGFAIICFVVAGPVANNVVFLVAGIVVFIVVAGIVIPGSLSDVCVLLFDYRGLLSGPALVLYMGLFLKNAFCAGLDGPCHQTSGNKADQRSEQGRGLNQ